MNTSRGAAKSVHRSETFALAVASLAVILLGCHSYCPRPSPSIVTAAMLGDLDLLKSLEAAGASLNYRDPYMHCWTPLMAAIYHCNTNITQYLLQRKVDLNVQDVDGQTALIWAVRMEDTNTVRALLQKGADPFIRDSLKSNAFNYARAHSDTNLLYLLQTHLRKYPRPQDVK
jgi:ankyrin repeat protein